MNEDLDGNPQLINEDPYSNWIIKVKMSDDSELGELMSAADYEKSIG